MTDLQQNRPSPSIRWSRHWPDQQRASTPPHYRHESLVSIADVKTELLPGYLITERIGSGGYGEVYRAIAPGGVEKAIKTLYGYHDEALASLELKALERVKSVRHPFLIAIDRFEVVDGRLLVVTELAEQSLAERFQQCRRDGLAGIPREELLGYLRDAADALDYMHRMHGLQHLDVKPENLLILGGHVKVADFGLVKDVSGPTRFSQVCGLTPTYAAPELFDNRPGARTDQYSLAIVYQEMLTGSLPFPGRTAAQLVAQHTQAAPRVGALPSEDRPHVLKALAKDPKSRFASSVELIDALRSTSVVAVLAPDEGGAATPSPAGPPDATPLACGARPDRTEQLDAISPRRSSRPPAAPPSGPAIEAPRPSERVSVQAVDVTGDLPPQAPASMVRPTLLVGLGGQGVETLEELRQLLRGREELPWSQCLSLLAFDTQRRGFALREDETAGIRVPAVDLRQLPLRRPQHYRERSPDLLRWLSRRWLYNIPRSLDTQGLRPLGRLALIDNARVALGALHSHLQQLLDHHEQWAARPTCSAGATGPPRIVVVASVCGGTGSAIALEVAAAIRNLLGDKAPAGTELIGVFGDAFGDGKDARDLGLANAYAFLSELHSAALGVLPGDGGGCEEAAAFDAPHSPFDAVYYGSAQGEAARLSVRQWVRQTAEFLATELSPTAGRYLSHWRLSDASRACGAATPPGVVLRSYATAALAADDDVALQAAKQRLGSLVLDYWQCDANSQRVALADVGRKLFRLGSRNPKREVQQDFDEEILPEAPLNAAEKISACLVQALADKFGDAATTRFAAHFARLVAEEIGGDKAATSLNRQPPSRRFLYQLVDFALQDWTRLTVGAPGSGEDDSIASVRVAAAMPRTANDPENFLSASQLELLHAVEDAVLARYVARLVGGQALHKLDLRGALEDAVAARLDELIQTSSGLACMRQLAAIRPDAAAVAASAALRPPRCGHRRRTLVLLPEEAADPDLIVRVREAAPSCVTQMGASARPLLLREGGGLSLAQVAAKLVEGRPELAEAASRLHPRIDVAWAQVPQAIPDNS